MTVTYYNFWLPVHVKGKTKGMEQLFSARIENDTKLSGERFVFVFGTR